MSHHQHGVCVVFILLGVICNFALCVENNDSRLLHLPKEEFVSVLSGIISGGDKNTASVVETASSEDGEFYDPMDPTGMSQHPTQRTQSTNRSSKSSYRTVNEETPRTTATREAQTRPTNGLSMGDIGKTSSGAQRGRRVKSDSLYFLQRSMESREKAHREGLGLTARTDDSDYLERTRDSEAGIMQYS